MPTARLPLGGQPVHRADGTAAYLTHNEDQRFINCFIKTFRNPITGNASFALSKRPSLSLASAGTAGRKALTGTTYFSEDGLDSDYVTAWIDPPSTVWLYKGTNDARDSQSVTNAIYASRMIQFLDGSTNDVHVVFWVESSSFGDFQPIAYNVPDETVTVLGDGSVGKPIGGFVYTDGYLFFMRQNGRIYNYKLNSWNTIIDESNYITNTSGVGRGVSDYRNTVVAFSENEIEFFRNAGHATGSPLTSMSDLRITGYGVRAPSLSSADLPRFDTSFKYLKAADTVFWMNNELSTGGAGVYMLENYRPKKISSPELDTILASTSPYRDVSIVNLIYLYGSPVLILFDPNAVGSTTTGLFYLLQVDIGSWSVWESDLPYTTGDYNLLTHIFQTSPEQLTLINTKWYAMNLVASSAYGAGGEDATPTMTVQTSKLDFGTDKRKFVHNIKLIADQQASGTATLEASDDDYATWTTLGTFDMTKVEKRINRCGSHKGGRAYRLTHSASTAFRCEALEIDYTT